MRTRKLFRFRLPKAILESPWEMFVALLCVLAGIPLLINGPDKSASSIDKVLPPILVYVWGGTLLIGGILILWGRSQRRTSNFRLERGGLALLASAGLIYGAGILVARGQAAIVAVLTIYTFVATCLVQYYKLGKAIKALEQVQDRLGDSNV